MYGYEGMARMPRNSKDAKRICKNEKGYSGYEVIKLDPVFKGLVL